MKSKSEVYANAGVDITAGYDAVSRIKSHVARTKTAGVASELGGFGGAFDLSALAVKEPVLISGTDGVGTKLKIAFALDKHDTIGIDCVAMCVNDVICAGATPLFFLDYIATGKLIPERIEQIVKGVADGCVQSGCALIGGETAEMPGFYSANEYDLAGYCTGVVDKGNIMDGSKVTEGDCVIAFPSSGVHSNGFSLVRKLFNIDNNPVVLNEYSNELGVTLGECLLTPTRIYVKPVEALMRAVGLHSIAHITGGGFYENIPRAIPNGFVAVIDKKSIINPPIFGLRASIGSISERDMFNTFNMGVGMAAVIAKQDCDAALAILKGCGVNAYVMGEVRRAADSNSEGGIVLC